MAVAEGAEGGDGELPGIQFTAKQQTGPPESDAWKERPYPPTLTTPYFCRWTNGFFFEKPLLPTRLPAVLGFVNIQWLLIGLGSVGLCAWSAGSDCRGSGVASSVALTLTFTVIPHNSFITFLFGVPFERCLEFHKVFAVGALAASYIHMTWCQMDDTGWAMTGAMTLGSILSLNPIRRKYFEVFYKFHWVMFVAVIALAPLHYGSHLYIYPGALVWLLDVLYRYFYLAMVKHPKDAMIYALPADIVRLEFPKGNFGYRPGQYLFICIPALAYFQWHPMSLSSAPHEEMVTVHIRALGDWTRRLHDLAKLGGAKGVKVHILFEGPYGEPMIEVDSEKYRSVLLVSGGIGITPMQSLCNNFIHQHARGRRMNKIWFIWSAQDRYIVDAMWDEVQRLPLSDKSAGGALQIGDRLPMSFQPDGLARVSNENGINPTPAAVDEAWSTDVEQPASKFDPLFTEFHLTRVREEEQHKLANIDRKVQPSLRFGRPDLAAVFQQMHAQCKAVGDSHCAVLVCGPDSMINDVRVLCSVTSGDGVQFDFHSETFDY